MISRKIKHFFAVNLDQNQNGFAITHPHEQRVISPTCVDNAITQAPQQDESVLSFVVVTHTTKKSVQDVVVHVVNYFLDNSFFVIFLMLLIKMSSW